MGIIVEMYKRAESRTPASTTVNPRGVALSTCDLEYGTSTAYGRGLKPNYSPRAKWCE